MRLRPAEFKILQHLREARLCADHPGTLHLMLSGGKDSVALLEILHRIERLPQAWSGLHFNLTLHHFNHCRRAEESNQDEALCIDLARHLGLPILIHRWSETLNNKLKDGLNFHALAREWRYQSVRNSAVDAAQPGNKDNWMIVTAHHRRDHAETLLHNLVRGCGAVGLHSMSPWSSETRLLRPLLWLAADELDGYIQGKSLPHREDSSNQQLDYTRNRLRNVVLTELELINPQAVEHIWTLSQDLKNYDKGSAQQTSADTAATLNTSTAPSRCIELHKLTGVPQLRDFLLNAEPVLARQLTREKLANILAHVRKLVANQSHCEGYKIALSERSFVTINSKRLEIKVTS
ncbi:MAG: tRNA lysidine(34) synthetase TilS [Betaproteobacteria bacterium]|nr:tRNA lysidine(34) synthetase TilS [Betaproteobacteria bacterium]